MEFFTKLNQFLDKGYKLTDSSCPICKSSIVYNPQDKSLFCIKCNLPIKMENEIIDKSEEKSQQPKFSEKKSEDRQSSEEYELIQQAEKKSQQSSDYSQKLAQYLLKGWAMLEDSCGRCLIPVMRSKSGDHICVGCNWKKYVDPNSGKTLAQALKEDEIKNLKKQFEEEKSEQQKQQSSQQQQQPLQQQQQQPVQQQQQTVQQQAQQTQQTTQLQQPVQQQQTVQQVPQVNSQAQQNLNDQIYSTLLKAAQFYDRQIDACIQNNQISQVEHIVSHNIKELIQVQQQFKQCSLN